MAEYLPSYPRRPTGIRGLSILSTYASISRTCKKWSRRSSSRSLNPSQSRVIPGRFDAFREHLVTGASAGTATVRGAESQVRMRSAARARAREKDARRSDFRKWSLAITPISDYVFPLKDLSRNNDSKPHPKNREHYRQRNKAKSQDVKIAALYAGTL